MTHPLIKELSGKILARKKDVPLRVGIDGIDGAGKTHAADQISHYLAAQGHPVIRSSIDGFHNPRQQRYQRGSYSPEGYYYDSFNYEQLKRYLLEPLEPTGDWVCRPSAFDFETDTEDIADEIEALKSHILIFDGVFLFRPEIIGYWDIKIFLEIAYSTSLARGLKRDLSLFGDEIETRKRYRERYIPGQKIYQETVKPQEKADLVIDNNDFANPFFFEQERQRKHTR